MKKQTTCLTQGAMTAALYVVLTMLSHAFGLDSGAVQLRFSEALCILPMFSPAAIMGLFVGCILSNLLAGGIVWDVIFGSLATLIGAVGTYKLRHMPPAAIAAPIIANTVTVPFVLAYGYGLTGGILYFMLTVGAGELISCGVFGSVLYITLKKYKKFF